MKPFPHTIGTCASLEKEPMQISVLSNNNKNKQKKQATGIALGDATEWYSSQVAVLLGQKTKVFNS